MSTHPIRMLATLAAVVEIGIHLYLTPDHLSEMPYMGWLFVVAAMILTAAVVGLAGGKPAQTAGYLAGAAVNAGMYIGFIASRTIGLPGGYREGWLADDALGIPSLAFEIVFIACAAIALRPGGARTRGPNELRHNKTRATKTTTGALARH